MRSSDEYPVLGDLPAIEMPARSVLYHMEPVGKGTGRRESLISYLDRLAWAHRIPQNSLRYLPGANALHWTDLVSKRTDWPPSFNVGGDVSLRWTSLLEQLTGYSGLDSLTFYPISQLVNTSNLVARHRRWCPECLAEPTSHDVPFTHLLWHIACVAACPYHELVLQRSCKCANAPTNAAPATRVPGDCPQCGQPLAETLPRRKASAHDVRIARIARDFLSDVKWDKGGWGGTDNHCGAFLQASADLHFGGKPARLAKALGVAKSSLHGWMKGKHRPSLPWLIALADRFDCTVVDILTGRADTSREPGSSRVKVRQTRRLQVSAGHHARIQTELTRVLSDKAVVTLTTIAKRFEVNTDYLRRKFPNESAQIVAHHLADRTAKKLAREEQHLAAIRARAEQLAETGVRPTARLVMDGMPRPGRYSQFMPRLNKILSDVRMRMDPSAAATTGTGSGKSSA